MDDIHGRSTNWPMTESASILAVHPVCGRSQSTRTLGRLRLRDRGNLARGVFFGRISIFDGLILERNCYKRRQEQQVKNAVTMNDLLALREEAGQLFNSLYFVTGRFHLISTVIAPARNLLPSQQACVQKSFASIPADTQATENLIFCRNRNSISQQ